MTLRCEPCNREFETSEALAMHNSTKHSLSSNNVQKVKSKMSKKTIFLILGILAILVVGYFFVSARGSTGNTVNDNVQRITLSFQNYNYYPNAITVKEGVPVEITLDGSIGGCYRSFNIVALGVSQYSSKPSETIKFTPIQKGTFEFACSMRMGRGTIIVE